MSVTTATFAPAARQASACATIFCGSFSAFVIEYVTPAFFSALAKSGASNCTQRTDDFVSGSRTQTWIFADFVAVAPVATATATPATATARTTLAALPVTRITAPSLPPGLRDSETLLRTAKNVQVNSARLYSVSGHHPICDGFSFSALARADDCVADLGGAVAVLEGSSVGCDVGVAGDRGQDVVQLVDEGVSPADDVARWPPVPRERVLGLCDEHTLEAACPVAVGAEDLQLVEALHVEEEGSLGAVDLPLERVSPAECESSRLDRADRAILKLDRRLDCVVDLAPWDECAHEASDGLDLPDEVASEVDHVSREIAEGSRTSCPAVEAPDLFGGIAPVLKVPTPEVTQLAELGCIDHLSREAHGGNKAVVERAHVLDASRRDAAPDLVAFVRVTSERLLADHVLARVGGSDRRS